ncbi:diguanylate cyclase [Chromatium okenii]|uniref:diguanylate cyclase domain-containing protein n=1 Tax=Chromatium okenii TaxID=61644 RepID=UPI001905CD53|nr:diguanylate cyclase [Chromatium okenii]
MNELFGAQLLDHLQSGIVLLNQETKICAWNQWMTRHTALDLEQVAEQPFAQLFPEIVTTRLQDCIHQALHFKLSSILTPGLNLAILPLYKNPKTPTQRLEQLIYITPVPRYMQMACLIQIHDMTATVRRERRLRAQSTSLIATTYRDALTGVGNRRRFDHDLMAFFTDARSKQQPLALLMIDIDDFKAYNDQLGHLQGDECLTQVATVLQEGLRQRGDSVARYGGEEFALLLPDADVDLAYSIAERLRTLIETANIPHPASRTKPHITISIGVSALIPAPHQTMKTLIEQADQALYQAKDAGRNRCLSYNPPQTDNRIKKTD